MPWELEQITALAALVNDYKLAELTLSNGEHQTLTIKSALSVAVNTVVAAPTLGLALASGSVADEAAVSVEEATPTVAAPEVEDASLLTISSPMVGTYYSSSSPDNPPFVEVGQRVSVGQTLCILEAMKQMNAFESEHSGVVVAVLASNQEPVEYGQPLFKLKV